MAEEAICKIPGCGKPVHNVHGWCRAHYKRWWRHGSPTAGGVTRGTPLVWLHAHKDHAGEECLIWPFSRSNVGYAVVRVKGRMHIASRVMCELVNGPPLEQRFHAAHSCGNGHEGCVNPKHLGWKTPADNNADKWLHGTQQTGARNGNFKP